MKKSIKLLLLTIIAIFICLISNKTYATDKIDSIKYYDNLVKNNKVVTVLLDTNNKSRKITKSEIIKKDNKITKIINKDGKELNNDFLIKTGDKIINNNQTFTVVLYGDVNGDSYICDIEDMMMIVSNYLGKKKLTDIEKLAANLENTDNVLDIEDILKMINMYLGKLNNNLISKDVNGNIDMTKKQSNTNNKNTPVSRHGKLQVKGTNIIDENGNNFQIKGVSTHGLQWFPQYVNKDTFNFMRDNWGINGVRLAMYTDPNAGYTKQLHTIVDNGVKYATESGLYAIIDWHILSDGNPNTNKAQAIEFFKEMATKYKDNNNVLYEICNEPNGDVQWQRDIKPYAEEIIKEIRKIDNDAIIIVGTPTWSQDVDVVSQNPITGYNNIMYTLHFYAATHKDYLREKMNKALNAGLPIFVTEFGICDASGNGGNDENEANKWIDELNKNNVSWMCWNLSNKNESSALLQNTDKITGWTENELSEEGKWLIKALKR